MILAFCMTLLGVPMLTFLPYFAKKVFLGPSPPGRDTVDAVSLSASGIGSIVGIADHGLVGQYPA